MTLKQIAASTSTNTSFGGTVTSDMATPVDLSVTEIQYKARFAGNYALQIDGGTAYPTVAIAASTYGNLLAGASVPINLARGKHTFKVTKSSGSTGWFFTARDCYLDPPWMYFGNWQEAGGGETGGFGIDATPSVALIQDGPPSSATWTNSGTPRSAQTYDITWDVPVRAYGLFVGVGSIGQYEVLINGVQKGTTGSSGAGRDSGLPGSMMMIVLTTPFDFAAGVAYTISVRLVSLASAGYQYINAVTSYSNAYFDQGAWVEPANVTPNIQWLFELAPTSKPEAMLLLP